MSDDAPKKKGGKLPIIIALVAVLGGGGFFMTKGKKDAKKEPREINPSDYVHKRGTSTDPK